MDEKESKVLVEAAQNLVNAIQSLTVKTEASAPEEKLEIPYYEYITINGQEPNPPSGVNKKLFFLFGGSAAFFVGLIAYLLVFSH